MSVSAPSSVNNLPNIPPVNNDAPSQPNQPERVNCMQRVINWLNSVDNPLLRKIGTVGLATIVAIGVVFGASGIGFLVGAPLLVAGIVFIPVAATFIGFVVWRIVADKAHQ